MNSFGGRFRYSKVLRTIDATDAAITSNITKVRIRRDLKVKVNSPTQYEICFGNKFHANPSGKNIKSTGFKIAGETSTVYFTDTPNEDLRTGTISIVKDVETITNADGTISSSIPVVVQSAGTVNYVTGEILIGAITIVSTELTGDIVEIQAFPESNDIIGLNDLYISFSIAKSNINMVKDVIASGDDISGTVFSKTDYYRSSYSNGELKRI